MLKLPISTNLKHPRYFVSWEEQNEKGVIRVFNRVFELELNRDQLLAEIVRLPGCYNIRFGDGRANNTRTMLKVDHIEKHVSEDLENGTDDDDSGSD